MARPAGRIENRIRRLRFDAGEMTQKDLADRVGGTRQTVLAIENGKYFPTGHTVGDGTPLIPVAVELP